MDKNSLIQEIKNDLNSIKKQVEVTLAKLAVLESMIELDNKLGISVQTSGAPVAELGVRSEELGVEKLEPVPEPVAEPAPEPAPEPIKVPVEIAKVAPIEEQKIEPKEDKEPEKEDVKEEIIPNSSLLTPNCEAQVLRNLMSVISLGDKFRFRHDLFSDDNDLFKETIEILNTLEDFEKAVDFLDEKFNWDPEDATVVYFYDIIKPKF